MYTIEQVTSNDEGTKDALKALKGAKHPVALTGAGISVESGIPDFRSPGGLWELFAPDEYATYQVFMEQPEKAWELFRVLDATIAPAHPNPAHKALAQLEEAGLLKSIITQNIDSLHQAGGSCRVLEIHGNHRGLNCPLCQVTRPRVPGDFDEPEAREERDLSPHPCCEQCGNALKPDIVLFGEGVKNLDPILSEIERCDLLIVVGTSAMVAPSSQFPYAVKNRGGTIMEFNNEPTILSSDEGVLNSYLFMGGSMGKVIDYLFLGKAGTTLPAFAKLLV